MARGRHKGPTAWPPGRVVPPSRSSTWLTGFTSAAMAFLAVFAIALSLASGRLANRWDAALANTATIRIAAANGKAAAETRVVLDLLATTPGVASAHAMTAEETRKLIEPWLGPGLPAGALPLPTLIEVTGDSPHSFDARGLSERLAAEAPGAVLDDHSRWRRPMDEAASRLRLLGILSLALIGAALAGMITLAVNASLAANAQVIRVLRLVGARDRYIAEAFVQRFTFRAAAGALAGAALATIAVATLPGVSDTGGLLTGLGFSGLSWALPFTLPFVAGAIALVATRHAAFKTLRGLT